MRPRCASPRIRLSPRSDPFNNTTKRPLYGRRLSLMMGKVGPAKSGGGPRALLDAARTRRPHAIALASWSAPSPLALSHHIGNREPPFHQHVRFMLASKSSPPSTAVTYHRVISPPLNKTIKEDRDYPLNCYSAKRSLIPKGIRSFSPALATLGHQASKITTLKALHHRSCCQTN
jgi:hypothetical protein